MSLLEGEIELVGTPTQAGRPRRGQPIELLVVVDDERPADEALAAFADGQATRVPHYYLDQSGSIHQLVVDARAGTSLGPLPYAGRRRNLDPISLTIRLERPKGSDHSDAQAHALHRLLPILLEQHGLSERDLVTILPDERGRPRLYPYLPPPTPIVEVILGASLDPDEQLFVDLYAETYKPLGGTLKIDRAFPIHAARFNLGAPVGRNELPPVVVAGRSFNFQPFARDTVFNEGTDYAAVQQLSSLFIPDRDEIPIGGLCRAMLDASFRIALKAARAAGVPLKGRETLEASWRFHQVARNAGYGPPLSGNYVSDDGNYAVQVFAGETLYTPVSDQVGCDYLSTTEPSDPAHAVIWRETYKVARAPYNPASDFHRRALDLKLGAPLTGVYQVILGSTPYQVQVWALDTLYKGPDGQIKPMSELRKPPAIQNWQPKPPKPPPPTRANALPAVMTAGYSGAPRPGDINWPSRPDFGILTDRNGAREQALGHIEYVRARGDFITITNGWDREHLVEVEIPQLLKIPGVRSDAIKFHRRAAAQLQALWAAWEREGLLRLIKSFDGAFVARTIRLKPTVLSNHAYGTAFDINARWNGLMRVAALVGQEGSVRELVPLANAHGFYWGGHWNYDGRGASDGMHFEWARPIERP